MEIINQEQLKPCEECKNDVSIRHWRCSDAKCIICGDYLCGGHILKHLEEKHCVGTHLYKSEEGDE